MAALAAPEGDGMKYIVYMHQNKLDGKVYIGTTSQKGNDRWRHGKGYKQNSKFYEAIQKFGWDNFEHKILFDNLTKEDAERKETEMIALYKSNTDEHGYNMQSGGVAKFTITEEVKRKIGVALKGRKFSEEHKRKIGEAQKGQKNHRYGKHHSEAAKEHIRKANIENPSSGTFPKRKVDQFDLQGNFIKTWDSMGEIQRVLGIKHCTISDCCRGKQKTSGGYIWKYSP